MLTLCLTAGPMLGDLLWTATTLPALRSALPQAHLVWECAPARFRKWLQLYEELDEVVADVEEMVPPPDEYLNLHPLWLPMDPARPILKNLFGLLAAWCPAVDTLPIRPYCPPLGLVDPAADIPPGDFVCFDPQPGGVLFFSDELRRDWSAFVSLLALPAVQVGAAETPLLPGAKDARGDDPLAQALTIRASRLFLGADTDSSCLAGALATPQIWLEFPCSRWWWPRSAGPQSTRYLVGAGGTLDLPALVELARGRLGERDVRT